MENKKSARKSVINRKKTTKLLLSTMLLALVAAGCSKAGEKTTEVGKENSSDVLNNGETDEECILTVGAYAYRLEDMMYYVYTEEEIGWMYNDMYSSFYGEEYSYWEEIEDEEVGLTGQELAKEAVILDAKKDLVWYQEALKRGITLDEEDKAAAKEAYNSFCEDLSDTQKNASGMGEELLAYFEKQQVIEEYKESLLKEAEFDEEATSNEVSAKENREYVFEYFEIYKEDDNEKPYPKEEMEKRVNMLKNLAKKLDKDSDMESMIPKEYKDLILYSDDALVESDEDYYGTYKKVNIDKALKKLKNGEVSQVFETEYSYFVARMKDNNSTEYYEEMVMEAVENAKNEIYDTAYENALEGYAIKLNEENWMDITLGNLIYGL
ncbi:MAG: hypothetical protein HFJ09_01645 [Lachnospiraceae bacterium]|nr:hypothetical protein [Lachnospiraceae bacterium]